jgi:hypothetical protein
MSTLQSSSAWCASGAGVLCARCVHFQRLHVWAPLCLWLIAQHCGCQTDRPTRCSGTDHVFFHALQRMVACALVSKAAAERAVRTGTAARSWRWLNQGPELPEVPAAWDDACLEIADDFPEIDPTQQVSPPQCPVMIP